MDEGPSQFSGNQTGKRHIGVSWQLWKVSLGYKLGRGNQWKKKGTGGSEEGKECHELAGAPSR